MLAKHHLWQNLPADLKSKAIYEPFRDELFTAELKRGAFLNGPPGMLSFSASAEKPGVFWETLPALKGSYATTGDLFSIYLQLHPSRGNLESLPSFVQAKVSASRRPKSFQRPGPLVAIKTRETSDC